MESHLITLSLKFEKYTTGQKPFKYQLCQTISQNPNTHKSTSSSYGTMCRTTHHTLPTLREQQKEIDRLTYMAQQCLTEESCRGSEGPTHYSYIGRGRSACHCSTPNMSVISKCHHHHRQYDRQGKHRYNHYDQRSQHNGREEQDERRYSNMYQNTDNNSTTVVLNALESFSAKQALAQSTLNAV